MSPWAIHSYIHAVFAKTILSILNSIKKDSIKSFFFYVLDLISNIKQIKYMLYYDHDFL